MRSLSIDGTSAISRVLLVLALAVAIAGCGSDGTGATGPGDVTGIYGLTTVDGNTLPFIFPNGLDSTAIHSATLTLNHDGTYGLLGNGSVNGAPGQIFSDDGGYTLSGSTITFTSGQFIGLVYSATATPGMFTASIPGSFVHSGNFEFECVFSRGGALPQ